MKRVDITVKNIPNYKLLDSGEGRKLENFSGIILDRPDTQAIWQKSSKKIWEGADAKFIWSEKGERWFFHKKVPESWPMNIKNVTANLKLSQFKHVGIFPEHFHQWEMLEDIENPKNMKMLNVFGYTGVATLFGASLGMKVTHVDSSKQTLSWLKENIKTSGLPADAVRTVNDDAFKYMKRLVNREEKFDIIFLDPPAFGRGAKGEVWKIEESLRELVSLIPKILSKNAELVILNGYASAYSARTFGEMFQEVFGDKNVSYGEIGIEQEKSNRILTTGIYAMWKK
jgi:23S rRNA (cytosine1962-C5)-methyltransferase